MRLRSSGRIELHEGIGKPVRPAIPTAELRSGKVGLQCTVFIVNVNNRLPLPFDPARRALTRNTRMQDEDPECRMKMRMASSGSIITWPELRCSVCPGHASGGLLSPSRCYSKHPAGKAEYAFLPRCRRWREKCTLFASKRRFL